MKRKKRRQTLPRLPHQILDYLKEQRVCCKASTLINYTLNLRAFYLFLKNRSSVKNPIDSLSAQTLKDYLIHLCSQNLAPYTKVNYLLAIKKYLAWEIMRGKMDEDLLSVLDRSKLPTVPEYLPKPLSNENDKILQKLWRESDHPNASLFLLLRGTGMRISEMIHLPPDCLVSDSKNETYLKVPLGKMNNERLIPICNETIRLIEKIRQRTNRKNPERLIGMKGSVAKVYSLLARDFKKLLPKNLTDQNKPVTFHRLRHTYATSLLTAGVSLPSLMKLLGHKRIEMTLRYAKITPQHLRNEYLRAIETLEKNTLENPSPSQNTTPDEPHDLLCKLIALTQNNDEISTRQKNTLLQRLNRLQITFQNLSCIPQKQKNMDNRG